MVINNPKGVLDRFLAKLKSYQGVAPSHEEADTVTLVKDTLSELFGFDTCQQLAGGRP